MCFAREEIPEATACAEARDNHCVCPVELWTDRTRAGQAKVTVNVDVDACFRREGRKKKAYSRNPGLCLCSAWGPNWIWAWIPANSQALSKETGWDPFNISSLAWRRHDERHTIRERIKTTDVWELSKIHPTEVLNEHLAACLQCSVAPERTSSKPSHISTDDTS